MASFLKEPIVKKKTREFKADKLHVAVSSMQGWRTNMEDADVVQLDFQDKKNMSLFGIFDGHGGEVVSNAVAETIATRIKTSEHFQNAKVPEDFLRAIEQGFLDTDEYLKANEDIADVADEMGSTGVVVILSKTHIYAANIGDSRCILCRGGRAEALTTDHKPTDAVEQARILSAGGSVLRGRVGGGVAVSRSFGDFWFKRNKGLKAAEQQVSCEPSMRMVARVRRKDEFLILACDGIWDVYNPDQVYAFIRTRLIEHRLSLPEICEELLDDCLTRGSRDNMTIIVILFPAGFRLCNKKGSRCRVQ